MGDVLEGGPQRSSHPRVWTAALLAVVMAAAVVVALREGSPSKRPPSATPSSTPPTIAAWPTAPGACGTRAQLPQITPAAPPRPMPTTPVTVGGAHVWRFDPARDSLQPLPVRSARSDVTGPVVTELVTGPTGAYALAVSCDGTARPYRISPAGLTPLPGGIAVTGSGAAIHLLEGAHHAWALTASSTPIASSGPFLAYGATLTPLDGGHVLQLPGDTAPVADTTSGLVVVQSAPLFSEAWPSVELLDPDTGALVRELGPGLPLGAFGRLALVQTTTCGPSTTGAAQATATRCMLASVDLATGRVVRTIALPPNRVPMSNAVFSPDGTLAAFELARATPDPRLDAGGGRTPDDAVVVNLDSAAVDVVPGLELAPEPAARLAFDVGSRWLLISTDDGSHGRLLGWLGGMPGPTPVTRVPGPLTAAPALLVR